MQDLNFHTVIKDGKILDGVIGNNVNHIFKPHFHNHIVVGIILSGKRTIKVQNRLLSFEKDDIFIINKCVVHSCHLIDCSYKAISIYDENIYDFTLKKIKNNTVFNLINTAFIDDACFIKNSHKITKYLSPFISNKKISAVNKKVLSIKKFINDNFNIQISISLMAKNMNINKFYLIRIFKKHIGISPLNYQKYLKIINSVADLKNDVKPIVDIALDNGFYDQPHYSKEFKKAIGLSPRKFIKSYHNFFS